VKVPAPKSLCIAGVVITLVSTALLSPASRGSSATEKQQAESRLEQVLTEMNRVRVQLENSRVDLRAEQQRLKEIDLAIQKSDLKFRALEARRLQHADELDALKKQRQTYLSTLEQGMENLGEQIRAAYRMGRQSRMKLVLNQDDPEQLGRMLAYYDYLNQAQAEKISRLRRALDTLDRMQASIDLELLQIETVQADQQTIRDELDRQRDLRSGLLAALSEQVSSEEARLRELERNRKDLETLLEKLTDVLADIPTDLGSKAGIASRKGRLLMPLKGPVRNAFGQRRGADLRWQGWLIGADRGAEVGAVAYGRIAFADWLRGYGLLVIIDHGQGYLSLYANNESLLREAGAWVEPGEVISIVGSNPGSEQGLYFELRKDGAAIDPAAWLAR
jgi:septal ring factor EnvC (AmiA/AmiB activator)